MSLRKVSLDSGFCSLMRILLRCEFQSSLGVDVMLIAVVRYIWRDSGPMVSAMRELFVSPMKRVRKEMTSRLHADWN